MPTLKFRGRVTPTAHQIVLSQPFVVHVTKTGTDEAQTYTVAIEGTMMTVTCDMPRFSQEEHLSQIVMRSRMFGQTVLNLFSFVTSTPYHFIAEEGLVPGSDFWQPLVGEPAAARGICTVCQLGDASMREIFKLTISEPNIFLALDDLIRGIDNVFLTRINCGRAVDGLKKVLAPDKTEQEQWEVLRNSLNLGLDYVKFITNAAK